MSFQFSDLAARIKATGAITPEDSREVRRWEWEDGAISRDEADMLFDLNDLASPASQEWADCFVEAISVYIVDQEQPRGYVSAENAAWLMANLDKDGKIETMGELELIVRVLEKALNAPDTLKAYALKQIETTVLSGEGPTRVGGDIHAGRIDDAEVQLLRRLIFASGGSGPGCVGEDEAEMLFRLKDATLGAQNATGWQQLFVQGVGNHLMAHSSYHQFSRDEAITHEVFMNDKRVNVLGFFARMSLRPDLEGAKKALFDNDDPDEIAARNSAEVTDAAVTATENVWLNARLDANHEFDAMELALLAFMKSE